MVNIILHALADECDQVINRGIPFLIEKNLA
jgi:hypothetical protein